MSWESWKHRGGQTGHFGKPAVEGNGLALVEHLGRLLEPRRKLQGEMLESAESGGQGNQRRNLSTGSGNLPDLFHGSAAQGLAW